MERRGVAECWVTAAAAAAGTEAAAGGRRLQRLAWLAAGGGLGRPEMTARVCGPTQSVGLCVKVAREERRVVSRDESRECVYRTVASYSCNCAEYKPGINFFLCYIDTGEPPLR